MNIQPFRSSRGFTLVEMVTLVLAVLIMLVLVGPELLRTVERSRMHRLGQKGLQLQQLIRDVNTAAKDGGHPEVWPTNDVFTSSTDFFKACLGGSWYSNDIPFDIFVGPGMTSATNITLMTPSNNVWCVTTLDFASLTNNTPFLFTRNLVPNRPDNENLSDVVHITNRLFKSSAHAGVAITWDGRITVIRRDEAAKYGLQYFLNPGSVSNRVLRPESPPAKKGRKR